MKQIYSSTTQNVVLCVDCMKRNSEYYCVTCKVHYCLNCAYDIHQKLKQGNKHEMRSLEISQKVLKSDQENKIED